MYQLKKNKISLKNYYEKSERRDGLMISVLDSGSSDTGSSPGQGHPVVFLGHVTHIVSLHPGI